MKTDSAVARVRNAKEHFHVDFDLTGVPMTSDFIGRVSDLDSMKEKLMPGKVSDRRMICVIHGLGGMGKTRLVIEYARLHKGLYTSFFWLDGETEESLIQSILNIAPRLPKDQRPRMDVEKTKGLEESGEAAQEVLCWFARKENTRWLLIFDNVDKTSYEEGSDQHTESSSYDITHYFPRGDSGSIIVTTRLQRLESLGTPVALRKLGVLDGLSILQHHVRRSLKRSDCQATSEDMSGNLEWDPGQSFNLC